VLLPSGVADDNVVSGIGETDVVIVVAFVLIYILTSMLVADY
jgi:hypothetical protein